MGTGIAVAVVSVLLSGIACAAPATQAVGDDPLGDLRDRRRVVVVIAADATEDRLTRMNQTVADQASGFSEREITVIRVIAGRGEAGGQALSAAAVAGVLRRCDATAATPFRVVLIGKDGGVKLTDTQPVTAERLFGLIDSMPMRQREMKR